MERLDHTYGHIILENGIMKCYYNVEEMDIDKAKYAVAQRVSFSEGTAYPCFFDVTNVSNTSKEARDYLANEGNELVVASAIMVNSPVLKMAANFFIAVNKPKNPTRLFTDEASAIEWLQKFRVEA